MATATASTPPAATASTDSLASSSGGSSGSSSKESRFNRLIHRLHGSNSSREIAAMMESESNPSTPLRYAPASSSSRNAAIVANSPALSDIDDIPLERPVFESKFMRELQQGQGQTMLSSPSSSSSSRPPLAPSYSSPAAVVSHYPNHQSPPNNNNNNHHHHHHNINRISPPSARELERTRSSPIATSPLNANSNTSLKSRLVRVASSNSLFGKSSSSGGTATSIGDAANTDYNGNAQSPSGIHTAYAHRKTASLVAASTAGPSPSPRSRLAASVAANGSSQDDKQQQQQSPIQPTFSKSHAYRHSEDVRQYSRSSPALEVPSSAYGKNHASSPPLSSSPSTSSTLLARSRAPSPNLHALREQNGEEDAHQASATSSSSRNKDNNNNGGLFSGLSVSSFSLTRKRSVDGLSLASNASATHLPIPEDEEGHQDGELQKQRNGETVDDDDHTAKRNSDGSIEQKPSSSSAHHDSTVARPALGERYLSSDRVPSQDTSGTATAHKSTTPGFPRHMPNASYSSTYTNPVLSSSVYNSTHAVDGNVPSTSTATSTIQTQRTGLISSGLSESSRRFRSAFRLNKSRAVGIATPGAGNEAAASLMGTSTTTRRAMRVPLRQQQTGNEDDDEENEANRNEGQEESNAGASMSVGNSTTSPKTGAGGTSSAKGHSPTLTATPQEVDSHNYARDEHRHPTPPTGPHISHVLPHDSGNASRSRSNSPRGDLHNHDEEHEQREKERESARERAQLVLPASSSSNSHLNHHASSSSINSSSQTTSNVGPHKITVARPVKVHALQDGNLKPGRALRGEQQEAEHSEENNDSSPEMGRSASAAPTVTAGISQTRHARTASHARLEDLMLVQESGNLAHARPASRQQNHARNTSDNTLVAVSQTISDPHKERGWQVQPQQRDALPVHRDHEAPLHRQHHQQQQQVYQEQEEVLAIDNDKENAVAGDWYRQHREKRDEKDMEKARPAILADRQGDNASKPRQVLGQARKPLQEQHGNHQRAAEGGFLPEPRQQGPLPQQHRVGGKLSSSSSNGGLGYFPSDRQVVVNDYAVPTKRSGDTPPSSNEKEPYQPFPRQQQQREQMDQNSQYPYQQHQARAALPPSSRPPAASLPALPSLPSNAHDQQNHQQAAAPVQKRAPGTVTVQGKTYTRMGLLGRGGSSKVFRVCDKDHLVYALKKIDLGRGADSETYQAFLNEISLLEALRGHDRIIQLVAHEVNEAKKSLIMVMEIGEIDLNALLQERISKSLPASMNFIRYMWEQMLEAVNIIHEEGIVHTDLKPANFVLVKGALKLIDFGIAKAIPNDTTNIARDQQIGTANYMSPEALNPHNSAKNGRVMKLGRPSDVWSLGCILYQMVYGHTPFGQIKNLAAKMNAIQTPGYAINFPTHAIPSTIKGEPLPDLAVRVEDDLLAVMKSCLRYEPKKRATIPELLMDPFLRREESARSRDEDDSTGKSGNDGHVSLDLVSAIVKQTLNWSNGRQPTRGEQERFVEAILRQANGMIR